MFLTKSPRELTMEAMYTDGLHTIEKRANIQQESKTEVPEDWSDIKKDENLTFLLDKLFNIKEPHPEQDSLDEGAIIAKETAKAIPKNHRHQEEISDTKSVHHGVNSVISVDDIMQHFLTGQ